MAELSPDLPCADWGIKENYKREKQRLEIENFSGRSPWVLLLPIPTIVTADSTDRDRCTHRVPTGVVFLR